VIAAYRDRYRVTDDAPLGAPPESAAQKIDAARAKVSLNLALSSSSEADTQERLGDQGPTRRVSEPGRAI